VAGEGDARVVDDALVHRSGDERVELAAHAAGDGGCQRFDHVGSVGDIRLARSDGARRPDRQHINARARGIASVPFTRGECQAQLSCPRFQHGGIGDQHQRTARRLLCETHGNIRPDTGGLAGGEGNDGNVRREA
jgi:hypothetical protein